MKNFYQIENKFIIKKINDKINKKSSKDKLKFFNDISNLNLGIYILVPIFLGLIIGYNLDKYNNKKSFFIVIFIILGVICSFYNLFKLVKES